NARKRGDLRSVTAVLRELHENYPADPFVAAEYAEHCFGNGDSEEAQTIVRPFASNARKNPRLLNHFGRCLMMKGEFEQATIYLQQADLINPYNIDRLMRLGEAYLNIDHAKRAQKSYERVLNIDPDSKDAKRGLGQSLLMQGEINDALIF